MKLKIKKIHPEAKIPTYAYEGDAGLDLYTVEKFELQPGERKSVPLGLAIEIPNGYVGLIHDKSSLSHKYGIKTIGNVIDAGYRGEIHAAMVNLSDKFFTFEKGHKIVQLLIQKIEQVEIEEVEILSETERGNGKMGSSGR